MFTVAGLTKYAAEDFVTAAPGDGVENRDVAKRKKTVSSWRISRYHERPRKSTPESKHLGGQNVKHRGKLLLFVILAGLGIGFLLLRDNKAPQLTLNPADGPTSAQKPPTLTVEDAGTGLKSLVINVTQGGKVTKLVDTTFKSGVARQQITLPLEKLGLKEGPIVIDVKAKDRSTPSNSTKKTFSLVYDIHPPVISVLTTAHNIIQGGSGLVMFRVSEKVRRAGVQVADRFFPAFHQEGDVYACLFAFPYNLKPADFLPRVVAEDLAGNERSAGFYYHVKLRPARSDQINLSQAFLGQKMPEFQNYFPNVKDPLELFLHVNGELRAANIAKLKELSVKTVDKPLWQGTFLRLPNAAPKAGFNEARDYIFNGKKVDHQVHLGLDLASLAASPVPASNSGTVIYAKELGIYGQCVIIDHGLGLQSLYSHLSSIDVKAGDKVNKGQIIGHTGATGMAGGDHLHFGIIVGGIEVSPVEWLDPHWIKDNFTSKWNQAVGGASARK
jgi:murein DD-endopeptidase MepM/ murein hydrolase activator NlpD